MSHPDTVKANIARTNTAGPKSSEENSTLSRPRPADGQISMPVESSSAAATPGLLVTLRRPRHRLLATLRRLNHQLLASPKIIFFGIGALYYVFYSFRMKFIKNYLGLEEDIAGLLQAVMQFASFFGVTGWSSLADYRGLHKRLLVGLCLAMAAIFQTLLLAPALSGVGLLALSTTVMALFGLALGGVMPLADYQTLKLLKDHFHADPQLYGRQVLWGTVASGLTTYGMGLLIDAVGVQVIFGVLPTVAILAALAVLLFGYPDRGRTGQREEQSGPVAQDMARTNKDDAEHAALDKGTSAVKWEQAGPTARNSASFATYIATMTKPRFLLFLLMVLSIGIGRQIATTFLPYYLSEEIGLADGQYGRAYLGSSLLTIVLLYCGPWFLERLSGPVMLVIGLGAMTLRLGAYSFLRPSAACHWLVMAIEGLSSTSFAFTHLAGVREAAACAPRGWEAAFQAAYTCAYVQFPAVFGSVLGGIIYRRYRGAVLMRATSLLSVFSFTTIVSLLLLQALLDKGSRTSRPRLT